MKHLLNLLLFSFILISCQKENLPPVCTIYSPEEGETFVRGDIVTIAVNGEDTDGSISEIQLFIDNEFIKSFMTTNSAHFSWDSETASEGSHEIKVIIIDNDGNNTIKTLKINLVINIPLVTTGIILEYTPESAVCTGKVQDAGGSEIIEKGICWSKNQNPTIEDFISVNEAGFDSFHVVINNLEQNTQYFLKAFAKNEKGIGYGNQISLTTYGIILDSRDWNTYYTVKIGDQVWMADNLAYLPNVVGSEEPNQEDYEDHAYLQIPFYYVNEYEGTSINEAKTTDNYKKYGVLYNWTAARSACPENWHLPSLKEWQKLAKFVSENSGGLAKDSIYNIINVYKYFWRDMGELLKARFNWEYDYLNGVDSFGFKGFPGGWRYSNIYAEPGQHGMWWTATQSPGYLFTYNGYFATLYNGPDFILDTSGKDQGFSVRCVKN